MTATDKRLKQLQRITGTLAERALQPVAEARARIHQIEAHIASIASHRAQLTGSANDPSIAGTMLNQADRLRIKQAAAMRELASAHVALEKARRSAAKAVGRDQVLGAMAKKRNVAALMEARRRLLR